MEDILASIRRILNEDEAPAAGQPALASSPPPARPSQDLLSQAGSLHGGSPQGAVSHGASFQGAGSPTSLSSTPEDHADDVLVLDPGMMVPEPPAAGTEAPAAAPDAAAPHVLATQDTAQASPGYAATPASAAMMEAAAQAVPGSAPDLALDQGPLVDAQTRLAAASSVGNLVRTLSAGRAAAVYRGGPTLEDMVRELLRPLLKEWLDSYLPPLVERLVATEIEKVVRSSGL